MAEVVFLRTCRVYYWWVFHFFRSKTGSVILPFRAS